MNHIKRLQESERANLKTIGDMAEQVNDLRMYLQSEKFRCGHELDNYVNINDVLKRLEGI